MKIAITIATYRRPDGKTPSYLGRLLDSIYRQTHKDYRIYLIGDDYDDQLEWFRILVKFINYRMKAVNLKEAVERSKYKDKTILWSCGGVNATNFGAHLALKDGFDYICHVDHDDYWKENHLELISNALEQTHADWVCTKAEYGADRLFPEGITSNEHLIPFLPVPGGVINSSTCYNYRTIPHRYRDMHEATGTAVPSDADLWDRVSKFIQENNLTSYLINEITCYHKEEGYLLYG